MSEIVPGSIRQSARNEIPQPWRRDVRLLGDILGQVLVESEGQDLLDDVERLRRTVIAARESDQHDLAVEAMVASWSLDRAEQVARAFTCYFHLANLAEERHRARVLRQRNHGEQMVPESLAATVASFQAEGDEPRLYELLAELQVHPVFTAHPTEARRRAVVEAIGRVGSDLDNMDDARASSLEVAEAHRRLLEDVDTLWRTAQLRSVQVQPLDEVRTAMAVFDQTLFSLVPSVYRALDMALNPAGSGRDAPKAVPFLRLGSWIGGDRDGNAHVTAEITEAAMAIQSEHVLHGLEAVATRIARAISADEATTPASPAVVELLALADRRDPVRMGVINARAPGEPHRRLLFHIADRIRATREEQGAGAYGSAAELAGDLDAIQTSLLAAGADRLAHGELQHLIWQVATFGFHLAELEIRQHSSIHETALAELRSGTPPSPATEEVLATIRAVARIQRRYGVDACRRYVISFTRSAADVAAVYELATMTGQEAP
ncbi:MAG TPA: phosphoenolpyruvate carboxylase, partial [Candidatus Dormibacteraeota bacterium]|nr:phosphoenolpyruvate carboxylase [Candidatus Dormibacteraeota bacterium]